MSLVICFAGRSGAIVAGDMREILFGGDDDAIAALERDLYSGEIATEEELKQKAAALGVTVIIRDSRRKISRTGEIVSGEVGERDRGLVRRRRVYATAGAYAVAEMEGRQILSLDRREGSGFVVLGNEITKRIARECINEYWQSGSFEDAVKVIVMAMETASRETPTVSSNYGLVQTRGRGDLGAFLEEEKKSGQETKDAG